MMEIDDAIALGVRRQLRLVSGDLGRIGQPIGSIVGPHDGGGDASADVGAHDAVTGPDAN